MLPCMLLIPIIRTDFEEKFLIVANPTRKDKVFTAINYYCAFLKVKRFLIFRSSWVTVKTGIFLAQGFCEDNVAQTFVLK